VPTVATKKGVTSGLIMGPPRTARRGAAAGASTAGARQVWVLREGVPAAVAVTPGITDGRMTEITGGDLKAGMAVITDQIVMAAK
jgi:HlyD family secretion protein